MIRKLIEEIIEKYYREIDEYYSRYREDEDGFSSCAYNNDFLAIAWIEADGTLELETVLLETM